MKDSVRKWAAQESRTVAYIQQLDPATFMSVRYEALASQAAATALEVCTFLNIGFESKMVDYWQADHHPLGGNAGSKTAIRLHQDIPITTDRADIQMYIEKGSQIFLDERWRDELTERDIETFEQIGSGLNRDNGYGV